MQNEKPAPLTVASADYQPADVYCGLRDQILRLCTEGGAAGFKGIVGALMETGYRGAVATVVMLADGTTSLYLSTGGGFIGAGQHKRVAAATAAFLEAAGATIGLMEEATAYPLPLPEHTRFYLLSPGGAWTAEAKAEDLGNNRLPLSPLFHLGHAVIAGIREHSEARGGG